MYIQKWLTGRNEKMESQALEKLKALNNDQLIAAYRTMRLRRDEAKKVFNEGQKPLLEAMQVIENIFLQRFEESGETASKTKSGTAYTVTETTVTVKDWGAFLEYVNHNAAWEMLERRASKSAVTEFVEEHGSTPPGLALSQSKKVNIRANTGLK
jgi:hypothetical protein